MAGRVRPGPLRVLWQNFVGSLRRTRDPRAFIGEDYLGNKYYEQIVHKGRKPIIRTFESQNKDEWESIPPEWEAWLRLKRSDAPTQEEIEANLQLMYQKQHNARLLEAKRLEEIAAAEGPAALQSDSAPAFKEGEKRSFPVYPEYQEDKTVPSGVAVRDRTIR